MQCLSCPKWNMVGPSVTNQFANFVVQNLCPSMCRNPLDNQCNIATLNQIHTAPPPPAPTRMHGHVPLSAFDIELVTDPQSDDDQQCAWLARSVWYNYQLHHLHCLTIDKYKDNWAQSCLSQSIKVGSFVNWRIQIIENNNVFCSFLGSLLPNGPLQAMPWTASDIMMQFTTIGSWHLDKPWFTGRNNNTNNNPEIPNND